MSGASGSKILQSLIKEQCTRHSQEQFALVKNTQFQLEIFIFSDKTDLKTSTKLDRSFLDPNP